MLKKNLAIILALSLVIVTAAAAWAGPFGQGYGRGAGRGYHMGYGPGAGYGPGYHMGYGVNNELTAEQRQVVEEAWTRHREQAVEIRARLDAKQAELDALMVAQTPDKRKIDAAVNEINELRGELFKLQTGFRTEMHEKFGADFGAGRGYGRGFGPGTCWR